MSWHALSFVLAAALYFVFVLPRWWELMGDVSHGVGTTMRIVTGAVLGLTALPVVFTLIRTRRPEFGTPQLALSLRLWSIVAHVVAGVLVIGTAVAEIWLTLDAAGQWLFGVYGCAAAIAILGAVSFYLAFVAEMPPPPPKPLKPKKDKSRADTGEAAAVESDAGESDLAKTDDDVIETEPAEAETAEATEEPAVEVDDAEASAARLRNRRPAGKARGTARKGSGGVAVSDD